MRLTTWLIPGVLLLGGCVDGSPVAPGVAPVEVIARGPSTSEPASESRCSVGRDQVAPGVHLFLIVADGADATVRVIDPDGMMVLESKAGAGRGGSASVDMVEGEYVVECTWQAGTNEEAVLRVVPSG